MEESITNLISNVGFPIVVSIGLFYQMNKTDEMYITMLREFKQVIDNNTKSLDDLSKSMKENDIWGGK